MKDIDFKHLLQYVIKDTFNNQGPAHAFKLLLMYGLTVEQAKEIYNPGQSLIDEAIRLLKIKYNGLYL